MNVVGIMFDFKVSVLKLVNMNYIRLVMVRMILVCKVLLSSRLSVVKFVVFSVMILVFNVRVVSVGC